MMISRRPERPLSLEELRELCDIDFRGNMGPMSKGTWGDFARLKELERQARIDDIRKAQERDQEEYIEESVAQEFQEKIMYGWKRAEPEKP